MANPLTLYVPVKQDGMTQIAAQAAHDNFVALVSPGLTSLKIVHYARLALIPWRERGTQAPIHAIALMTEFDGDMETYLMAFWNAPGGIKEAFIGLAKLALNPPDDFDPANVTPEMFVKFIVSNNLSEPEDNFSAYPWTVEQIGKGMPKG
jgi:hypothetical protein